MRAVLLLLLLALPCLANTEILSPEQQRLRSFLDETINSSESFQDRFDAEVWLVDMSARLSLYIADDNRRLKVLQEIHRQASRSQLPPELVLAVIEVESHFDHYAISRSGAQGLMQVMPFWKDEIGRPGDNLTDISTNLSYGCRILQFYLKQEDGRLTTALARYNGSAGSTVYSDKVEAAWRRNWKMKPLNWY
jgi:soluble lytic murein transglycosylase-like protein